MVWFLIFTATFLFNMAMTARAVHRRDYGWASAYALSAVWSALFAALEAGRAA